MLVLFAPIIAARGGPVALAEALAAVEPLAGWRGARDAGRGDDRGGVLHRLGHDLIVRDLILPFILPGLSPERRA